MNAILQFDKQKYETPLQMLDRLRREQSELSGEKLSYLGRLDPLAHGVMLVAVGEANKEREKYLGLSKTYKVQFLFGVSTDTGDVLGLINNVQGVSYDAVKNIEKEILNLRGDHKLPYPLYSSKTVLGKPLHEYGRENKEVVLPERDMNVSSVIMGDIKSIGAGEVYEEGVLATQNVKGDFRQEVIRKNWEDFIEIHATKDFLIAEVVLTVAGGTYVRSLADLLTKRAGIPCLAFDIERTNIGV